MKKSLMIFLAILLLSTTVFASYNVQIKPRPDGLRHDCELGQTTCFDGFFQECMRDSGNNYMFNTVETCRLNEYCDENKGCVKGEAPPIVRKRIELPPVKLEGWECEQGENKCSDDVTIVLGCKNGKWEERQVCSEDSICINIFGCIEKEELKKEVSTENYNNLINKQGGRELQQRADNTEQQRKELEITNKITGNSITKSPKNNNIPEELIEGFKKIFNQMASVIFGLIF